MDRKVHWAKPEDLKRQNVPVTVVKRTMCVQTLLYCQEVDRYTMRVIWQRKSELPVMVLSLVEEGAMFDSDKCLSQHEGCLRSSEAQKQRMLIPNLHIAT